MFPVTNVALDHLVEDHIRMTTSAVGHPAVTALAVKEVVAIATEAPLVAVTTTTTVVDIALHLGRVVPLTITRLHAADLKIHTAVTTPLTHI
jgi:hypothetical protein